jgi:hypothetical protein
VHFSIPFAVVGHQLRSGYAYLRSGVRVEGRAWLCDTDHAPFYVEGQPEHSSPQHVDVDLRFWNRRSERVTVLGITAARIPRFDADLAASDWPSFKPLTLEPGDNPQESFFVLVPKDAPGARVEATTGSWLDLEFRPSRGSERWARPRIRLHLGLRSADDRLG